MKTIDAREAENLLASVVLEYGAKYRVKAPDLRRGEHDTSVPHYFDPWTGAPACLVGAVLARLDVDLEDLGPANCSRIDGELIAKKLSDVGIRMTEGGVKVLGRAQIATDCGLVWGDALKEALCSTN